jgi:hypothetical protein
MNVVEDAPRNTDGEDGQLADRFVLDSARHVNDDALVQFDFFVVEHHHAVAGNDVIDLVGLCVKVELGPVDFNVVYLGGGFIALLDEWTNPPAGLGPGFDFGGVASEELGCDAHGRGSASGLGVFSGFEPVDSMDLDRSLA